MRTQRNAPRAKQPYEPPKLRRIKVVQGELAVAGCKTQTATMGPTVGCFRTNCKAVGS